MKTQSNNCPSCNCKAKNTFLDYIEIVSIFILIFILYQLSDIINIPSYLPNINNTDANIAIAFFTGIIASLSTCTAIVAGIVLSFGSILDDNNCNSGFFNKNIKPHLYFNIGRLISFFFFGALLGFFGSYFKLSSYINGIFIILIGILMLIISLNILNILPSFISNSYNLFIKEKINKLKNKDDRFIFIIGAITFFIPCGFTQSMQLMAIASGDAIYGAMIMLFFALGTAPILLLIGISSNSFIQSNNTFLYKIIGTIVLFIAIHSINSGITLMGGSFNFFSTDTIKKNIGTNPVPTNSSGIQIIHMDIDNGFKPSELYVKKNIPVRFEIKGVNVSGCTKEVTIPIFGLSAQIEKNKISVIEFVPKELGTIPFSCWMGMINGKIIVIE